MQLEGIKETWHKIALPNGIFSKVDNSLNDIRIFGINTNNDTIETPYILKRKTQTTENTVVAFKKLNESYNQKGYYVTFEVPVNTPMNSMEVDFKQENFDWKLNLEGSQDNSEWFTITEDYRILSIKNELTNYKFTKVSFPNSSYQYYRLTIQAPKKPELSSAQFNLQNSVPAGYRNYDVRTVQTNNDREARETTIEITLKARVPVSNLRLDIQNNFDYYRPITIQYLTDSIETEQGWKRNYRTLHSGTFSSMEKEGFTFNSTILQQLKVVINNYDNEPLTVNSVKVQGYIHELVARFSEPATYYLTYGNSLSLKPNYDITRFESTIPKNLTTLKLKEAQSIEKETAAKTEPLFKNKIWLWVIMGLIIGVLGWFSIKMIKQ
jgi:hypothetical protein